MAWISRGFFATENRPEKFGAPGKRPQYAGKGQDEQTFLGKKIRKRVSAPARPQQIGQISPQFGAIPYY